MPVNPFERFPPLAPIEEETWEFDYGIVLGENANPQEATAKRLLPLVILTILLFLVLASRLLTLQITRGRDYRLQAVGNSIRTAEIPAPRGLLLDREGNPVVKNVANFNLEVTPAYLPSGSSERETILAKVTETAGVSVPPELRLPTNRSIEPIALLEDIPYEAALALELKLGQLPGVVIAKRPRREYEDIPGIAHTLGTIGKISKEELAEKQTAGNSQYGFTSFIGKSGLEISYEDVLKGVDGRTQLEVDAAGRKIRELASVQPRAGNNLKLTLDREVQSVLSQALSQATGKVGSKAGAAIAIDPKTGGILGMSSFPTYKPEVFSSGGHREEVDRLLNDPLYPLVNRPIAGRYPPGSTIKPLWAAAALQEGTITTKTTVNSVGGFNVGQFAFKDWKSGGHGVTDVKKAIAESVNTFFYAVTGGHQGVSGLGIDRLKQYATRFGIGAPTGIDLPGEGKGFFPDPEWKRRTRGEGWFIGNTYQLGIGQGDVLVTPIELLVALTSIVNGGELVEPRLVDAVVSPEGNIIREYGKIVAATNGINPENLQIVKEGMRQTVTAGSARSLGDLPVEAAGKTGTAQYASNKKTHAWFFGFAPWQDPTIAVLVLVEGGGEGTTAAAPVAKEVFQAYFTP
ncbi:MAG TPA: penicillin-binding protein 2 [Anaerolineales bacterium]